MTRLVNKLSFFKVGKKRLYISIAIVSCLSSIFVPVAFAASSDPWYIKPIAWVLDLLLGVLGGIHDPMDHIFYNGCGIFNSTLNQCPDHSVYGLYSPDQFRTVIQRGFYLFGSIATFIVMASVVKSGVLLSLKNLSSTAKFEVNDALIKVMLASIMLTQFFDITAALFKANHLFVYMIRNDLQSPGVVQDYNGQNVPSDGRQINSRIQMNQLSDGLSEGAILGSGADGQIVGSPIAKATVSLASRGVAIWWEVFYLQRKIMISMLLILAPLWICCMFYPMLHEITMTAMKELWSQIIAQALHATLFWGYYHLIDNEMGWFQALVAMCLFIPISESIRFIFGATSQSGGRLATVGTLAGAAGIMNMTKAVSSLGKGASNAVKAYNGMPTGSTSGPAGMMKGMLRSTSGGGGQGQGQSTHQAGGSGDFSVGPVFQRQRSLRTAGELGAGFGSAALRMGLTFAGSGLGPIGAHLGGEVGGDMGDKIGYRAGVTSLVAGEAGVKGAKELGSRGIEGAKAVGTAARNLPSTISNQYNSMDGRDGDVPTRAAKAVGRGVSNSVSGAAGQYAAATAKPESSALTPEQRDQQRSEQREQAADRWGTAGEIAFGRGGFDSGASYGRSLHSGRHLTPQRLNDLRDVGGHGSVYTVETNGSSQLAIRDSSTGEYKPISNLGRGNPTLGKGETVVTGYQIQGQGAAVRMVLMKEAVSVPVEGSSKPNVDFQNQSHLYKGSGKTAYSGKPVDPNQFISPAKQSNAVDLRRKNFVSKV